MVIQQRPRTPFHTEPVTGPIRMVPITTPLLPAITLTHMRLQGIIARVQQEREQWAIERGYAIPIVYLQPELTCTYPTMAVSLAVMCAVDDTLAIFGFYPTHIGLSPEDYIQWSATSPALTYNRHTPSGNWIAIAVQPSTAIADGSVCCVHVPYWQAHKICVIPRSRLDALSHLHYYAQ